MNRLVNLDWLEVFCLEADADRNPDFFRSRGYRVDVREYGTPQYAEMFSVYFGGFRSVEVRRAPYSIKPNGGIFDPRACHIRLTNRACYQARPVDFLRDFLLRFGYTYQNVSRVDVCLDFVNFDNLMKPARFVARYFRGEFAKVNQCSIAAHGRDSWNGQTFHSVKWGSSLSQVTTKLYCKSLELAEKTDKPYIRAQWYAHGLCSPQAVRYETSTSKRKRERAIFDYELEKRQENVRVVQVQAGAASQSLEDYEAVKRAGLEVSVWRVEFSLKSDRKNYVRLDTGEYLEHNLSRYDCPEKLLFVFHLLVQKYFHFKAVEYMPDGSRRRKDRCRDVPLFQISPEERAVLTIETPHGEEPTRADKMLINRILQKLKSDKLEPSQRKSLENVLEILLKERAVREFNFYSTVVLGVENAVQ